MYKYFEKYSLETEVKSFESEYDKKLAAPIVANHGEQNCSFE